MEKRTIVLSDCRAWLACATMVALGLGALGCSSGSSPGTDAAAEKDIGGGEKGGTATITGGAGGTPTSTGGARGTTTATATGGRGGTTTATGGRGGTGVRDAAADLREDTPARDAMADLREDAPARDAVADFREVASDGASAAELGGTGGDSKSPTGEDAGNVCVVSEGRVVPAGAMFGNGCSCCRCIGHNSASCYGIGCVLPAADGGTMPFDMTPCQSNADCVAIHLAVCVFEQGCSQVQGHCSVNGACPYEALDYCGCDGQTFHVDSTHQYADRPYSHLGACP